MNPDRTLTEECINIFDHYVELHGPIDTTTNPHDVAVKIVDDMQKKLKKEFREELKTAAIADYESIVPLYIEYVADNQEVALEMRKNFERARGMIDHPNPEIDHFVSLFKTKIGKKDGSTVATSIATSLVACLLCCDLNPPDQAFKDFIIFFTKKMEDKENSFDQHMMIQFSIFLHKWSKLLKSLFTDCESGDKMMLLCSSASMSDDETTSYKNALSCTAHFLEHHKIDTYSGLIDDVKKLSIFKVASSMQMQEQQEQQEQGDPYNTSSIRGPINEYKKYKQIFEDQELTGNADQIANELRIMFQKAFTPTQFEGLVKDVDQYYIPYRERKLFRLQSQAQPLVPEQILAFDQAKTLKTIRGAVISVDICSRPDDVPGAASGAVSGAALTSGLNPPDATDQFTQILKSCDLNVHDKAYDEFMKLLKLKLIDGQHPLDQKMMDVFVEFMTVWTIELKQLLYTKKKPTEDEKQNYKNALLFTAQSFFSKRASASALHRRMTTRVGIFNHDTLESLLSRTKARQMFQVVTKSDTGSLLPLGSSSDKFVELETAILRSATGARIDYFQAEIFKKLPNVKIVVPSVQSRMYIVVSDLFTSKPKKMPDVIKIPKELTEDPICVELIGNK